MADFSLTTVFVVPVGSGIANSGATQALTAGEVGFYGPDYQAVTNATVVNFPYFYVAQGRDNTYLQGTKRSDKIAIRKSISNIAPNTNVTEWYKVQGAAAAQTQITEVGDWNVKCGDVITITLRAHSSYIDTLYFNGFTRSITVQVPCCECGQDPCESADIPALIAQIITKFETAAPNFLDPSGNTGNNPDNINFNTFFDFSSSGAPVDTLIITGKALTSYGVPCDIAAFPWEYDRMYFRTFVYSGPATTADFIVADACNIVAEASVTQEATYPTGTAAEIAQLEKNYYSYQAGYLKHLYRMAGYNQNFESYVDTAVAYDTYYIKFNEYDRSAYSWGDYLKEDSMVIIAVEEGSTESGVVETLLTAALGNPTDYSL